MIKSMELGCLWIRVYCVHYCIPFSTSLLSPLQCPKQSSDVGATHGPPALAAAKAICAPLGQTSFLSFRFYC